MTLRVGMTLVFLTAIVWTLTRDTIARVVLNTFFQVIAELVLVSGEQLVHICTDMLLSAEHLTFLQGVRI